jgi:hypothetical protein
MGLTNSCTFGFKIAKCRATDSFTSNCRRPEYCKHADSRCHILAIGDGSGELPLLNSGRCRIRKCAQSSKNLDLSHSSLSIDRDICQHACACSRVRWRKWRNSLCELCRNDSGSCGQLKQHCQNYGKHGAFYDYKCDMKPVASGRGKAPLG